MVKWSNGQMVNMSFEDLKNTADYVRGIALEEILKQTGSIKHRYDKSKWQTCQGVISVSVSSNGQKFMNWTAGGMRFFYYLEKKKRWWGQNFEAPLVYGGRAWLPVQKKTWELSM
jgi:hypothetical protein